MTVAAAGKLTENHVLLTLRSSDPLPELHAGQFAQLLIEGSPETYLRRPISINSVDYDRREIMLLIADAGHGTHQLMALKKGDRLNVVYPLGNQFSIPEQKSSKPLLIGGGVGVAPMLFLGQEMRKRGLRPTFLIGAKTEKVLLELDMFRQTGDLFVTTEDGSAGEKGYVTDHSILKNRFDYIATCGPKPMMMSVAGYAKAHDIDCEASLENRMACGFGACLCCVEPTTEGNLCVCAEGPVFNIRRLLWQI